MRARNAAAVGVAMALAVAALAVARRRGPTPVVPSVESTRAVRIVRRGGNALPEKQGIIRAPARVRAITEALGIDSHPGGECPADYAEADFGIVLAGSDVYVKRNVYVFGLLRREAGEGDSGGARASVVSVTSAGCKIGPVADVASLVSELRAAGTLD